MTSIEQMANSMIDNCTDYVVLSDDRMLVASFGVCSGGDITEVWLVDSTNGSCDLDSYPKLHRVLTAIKP